MNATHTVHILRTVISTRHLANASLEKSTLCGRLARSHTMKTLPALLFGLTPKPVSSKNAPCCCCSSPPLPSALQNMRLQSASTREKGAPCGTPTYSKGFAFLLGSRLSITTLKRSLSRRQTCWPVSRNAHETRRRWPFRGCVSGHARYAALALVHEPHLSGGASVIVRPVSTRHPPQRRKKLRDTLFLCVCS